MVKSKFEYINFKLGCEKYKKIELELISDADIYFFFEKRMRGGVSYISKRYIKVNNKYLKSYDLNKIKIFCVLRRK